MIANVPYHRMRPGLLSRIVKQIRNFINHRGETNFLALIAVEIKGTSWLHQEYNLSVTGIKQMESDKQIGKLRLSIYIYNSYITEIFSNIGKRNMPK